MKIKFWIGVAFAIFFSAFLFGLPEALFYWLEAFFLIFLLVAYKFKSDYFLYPALALLVLGAVLNIIGISFAEQVLRASLVFWLVGLGISLRELKK